MSNSSAVLNSASPSPAERRLGKFHGCYSPGNLHKTPKRCRQFRGQDDEFSRNYQFQHNISPFHRCKSVKINRNRKLWRAPWQDNSFEGNQSFPSIRLHTASIMDADTNSKTKPPPNTVRVDGPNGVRFNSSLAINLPGEQQSVTGLNQQQIDRLQQGINPNKAVFTIEPKTSKILIVNSKACSLLGYSSADLCNMNFCDLLRDKNTSKIRVRDGEVSNDEGTIVLLSGKVVEMLSSRGAIILVSLWIRQLETEGPCLVVVAEPVHSKEAILTVDGETGFVTCCESEDSALLFQVESVDKLIGMQISSLIPSVVLPQNEGCIPKHISKQKATGRTLDGGTFPLCLWIKPQDVDANIIGDKERRDSKYSKLYTITIRVFHNVSGLLVVDETGLVSACNHHFTMLTFGKAHSEVIGQPVTQIIPNFCQAGELLKMSHRRNMTLSPVPNDDDNSDSDSDPIDSCGVFNGSQKSACMSYNIQQSQTSQITHDKSSSAFCLDKSSSYIMTQTPTPTQDMVSSLSTTELKIDNDYSAVPDVVSGISGISIEEEQYCQANISKSRSENILGSENRENNINVANRNNENKSSDRSDSLYYSSKYSNENSAAVQRARLVDPAMRLSLDSSKYRQTLKSALAGQGREDKSSISVDLCDSNETSADFLTPINEMPGSGEGDVDIDEIEDLPRQSINGEDQEECEQVGDSSTLSPKQILELNHYVETPLVVKRVMRAHLTTSTPQNVDKCSAGKQDNSSSYRICDLADCPSNCQHKDGTYKGTVLHKDGTELSIIYTVSSMQMSSGNRVQCVWLGVQLSDEVVQMPHTTLASSINSTAENSLVIQGNKSVASRPHSMSLMSQCGEEQISGDYNKFYVTLKQIGKGAFGCVKMAYRRSDRLLVIAKFILKEKVSQQFWVDDKNGKKIPLEVSLLLTLKHPNIVNVLDVFENDKYFQMIMEKHGSGMDLFEFIERRPQLDEPLISYIFRQIGLAVDYLHSLSILHRDIKDENVIIDNRFHVKLIDFGSATFMNKDVLFSTFYGTTEYCSPEVLGGNKYAGPELEMWSMGVTLFVLTFFENPFVDIEDTIQGSLTVPPTVSTDLDHLLRWMLCKDPVARCTVSQLMAHQWINQTTNITKYNFADLIECETHEANPEIYYSGSFNSPRSSSPSNADVGGKEQSNPSEHGMKYEGKNPSKDDQKKSSFALYALSAADKDAQSDNYSLRSSADILDISSKPMSDAALTDISSDATGHAACDIEYDIDQYDCDSWDECEQDSFS